MAIKAMPWTIWSAVAMSMMQIVWCLVAGIAALGSFVALETVTAPDGASYRAIDCLSGVFDEPDASSPVASTAPGSVCMCSGTKISDVSCRCVLADLRFALTSLVYEKKANGGLSIGQRPVDAPRDVFWFPHAGRNGRHWVGGQRANVFFCFFCNNYHRLQHRDNFVNA